MPWLAIHTKPLCEADVAYALRWKVGLDVLWLHYSAMTTHSRRKRFVLRSYFPRYLFARATDDTIGEIRRTDGVAAIVSGASGPLAIPEAVIDELRTRATPTGRIEASATVLERKRYNAGDAVTVTGGALAGLLATVALDEGPAIRLWLQMFGGQRMAVVSPGEVAPSAPTHPPGEARPQVSAAA